MFATLLLAASTFFSCQTREPAWLRSEAAKKEWRVYLGDQESSHYSVLHQINKENVAQLQVAWTYHTGDLPEGEFGEIQCNPIIVNGVLYGSSPRTKIFALNAGTGAEIWKFDPFADRPEEANTQGRHRGVTYWQDEAGNDRRILFTAGADLFAVDARNGTRITSFGDSGKVRLNAGLDRELGSDGGWDLFVSTTTPGMIYKDLLILGTRVSEGPISAPGHIRAFDVRTGAVKWIFHTIPHPGEFGYDTWPEDAWKRAGGANCWSGMSVDHKRGLVFIPTGSAAYDFYGGNRKGQNLFANCLLALKAETGERVWHYQTVHHDLWDRDLPAPPNLVTLEHGGKKVEAVAQATKSGFVFVFDRETGEPLFPIEEKPYPASDLPGEEAWPTQPLPLKPPPFARQIFTAAEVASTSPEAREAALARVREVRSAGQFIPPSKQGSMIFPGFDGGAEWGGAGFDPKTGLLYVNSNEMPWILTMIDIELAQSENPYDQGRVVYALNCASCHGGQREGDQQKIYPALTNLKSRKSKDEVLQLIVKGKGSMPSNDFISAEEKYNLLAFLFEEKNAQPLNPHNRQSRPAAAPIVPFVSTGYHRFLDHEGYPAVRPPWGTLNAIDLNKGEIVWQVPLGEFEELTQRGIPPTGTENYGGPVVTASGLIFIGASMDEKFRAFDKDSGKTLWEAKLPAGGYATPSTYEFEGKQYVVIACGGGKMRTKPGDAYVAFALPEAK
ncbi:MAG: PQQ-binding-like beta-propeller repeat protein [bacterium]